MIDQVVDVIREVYETVGYRDDLMITVGGHGSHLEIYTPSRALVVRRLAYYETATQLNTEELYSTICFPANHI